MSGCFLRKDLFNKNVNYLYIFFYFLRQEIDSNIFQNSFVLSNVFWNRDYI